MQRNGTLYTILFAAMVCGVCSILVSGTSVLLKDRQKANMVLDRQRQVLSVAGLMQPGEKLSATTCAHVLTTASTQDCHPGHRRLRRDRRRRDLRSAPSVRKTRHQRGGARQPRQGPTSAQSRPRVSRQSGRRPRQDRPCPSRARASGRPCTATWRSTKTATRFAALPLRTRRNTRIGRRDRQSAMESPVAGTQGLRRRLEAGRARGQRPSGHARRVAPRGGRPVGRDADGPRV